MANIRKMIQFLALLLIYTTVFSQGAFAGSVTVNWDPNTESDLSGYKIYYGTQPHNYQDVLDVRKVTSFRIDNLTAGPTYYFAVTAYDLSGNESGFSAEVSATIPDPNPNPNNPPQLVSVTIKGETQVDAIFSEALEKASAETISNYSISDGIQVLGTILNSNETVVHLITTTHQKDKTYTLSVSNVKDKDGNAIAAGSSKSYTLTGTPPGPGDTTPPQLTYVSVVSLTELDVIFSEVIQMSSAESVSNYSINNGVQVQQAKLNSSQTVVRLTTSAHQPGTTYTLSVSNIRDLAENIIPANTTYAYQTPGSSNTDTTPPQLTSVTAKGETQVDAIFSEALEKASAETISNYSISDGIQVLGAILNSNETVVHLIATTHQKDKTYTLSVSNVKDKDGNTIAAGSSKNYLLPGSPPGPGDTTPPQLTYVGVVNLTELDVIFNETIQQNSAESVGNYSINNGIQVLQATLNGSQSIVRLTTTPHQAGANYTLSVRNIRDAAGNTIPANTNFSYQTSGSPTDTTPPQLSSVVVKGPTQIDVNFNEALEKASAETKGNYSINNNVEVMGAVLGASLTTVHIITSSHRSGQEYTITVNKIKDPAGNQIAANSKATYTFTSDQPPEDPGDGQTPSNFTLFQNYPNPFNPETEIRFYLEKTRRMELKVYNPLGQLVRTLVKSEMPAGTHRIVWDGTNNDGIEVPTGVYIYALEVNRDVVKGDLLVNVAMERRVKKMTLIR